MFLLEITDGLGCQEVKSCQGLKEVRVILGVGIRDCFGDVLPWLGGSPTDVHHPDVEFSLISGVNFYDKI